MILPYAKGKRSWPVYLHWWAAGDEFPNWTPDWFLDHWPARPLHWVVCRIFGHVPEPTGFGEGMYCIWCQETRSDHLR